MTNTFVKFNPWLALLLLGIFSITLFLFFKTPVFKEAKSIQDEVPKVIDFCDTNYTFELKIEQQARPYSDQQLDSDPIEKTVIKPNPIPMPELKNEGREPFVDNKGLKVQEIFKVDPPIRSIGHEWKTKQSKSNFTMPVSEGRDLEIKVEHFESVGEDGGKFIGTVVGAPGSKVNLSYRGSAEAGRIDLPSEGRSYQILPGKDGVIIVQDLNPSLEAQAGLVFPPVGIELPPVPNFIPPPPPSGVFEKILLVEPLP